MENKLEKMRKELRKRAKTAGALACLGAVLLAAVAAQIIPTQYEDERAASFLMGFQTGLLLVLVILAVIRVFTYLRAAGDDTRLIRLYNRENDERVKYIDQMAGKTCMNLSMIILVIAAVIAGYFSIEACAALCGAAIVVGLVKKFVRLYYARAFTGAEEQE